MNRNLTTVLVVLAVVAAVVAGVLLLRKPGPRAPVSVTLRVAVSPKEKVPFVAAHANSARFKYEIGQKAGVKPVLAQKLAVRTVSNTAVLEMRVNVQTKEEAARYGDSFLEQLQAQCGREVELTLLDRKAR